MYPPRMGFPRDLDEYPEKTLRAELRRRREARRNGRCDYCGGFPNSAATCKFPERHVEKPMREPLLMRFFKFLRDENRKPGVLAPHEMAAIIDQFRAKKP